ncbi:MAG: T9SS type A sorting domain-containing protein [Ignavibacteria bacterium]|nr:T9SS type A sorting domain-containing protein [Ignavibacteria bacterium]
MKFSNFLLLITLFLIINSYSFAQDTGSVKYLPLRTGNAWYYKTTYSPIPFPPTFHKESIETDSLINGKEYFKHILIRNSQIWNTQFIRIDSSNGNLLVYSPGNGCGSYANDKIIDSLASSPGNQISCFYQNLSTRRCISVSVQSVFGLTSETKEFYHDGLTIEYKEYAKNFGVISSCSGEPPPCTGFTNLIGCRIDGVIYGDTNLTNITLVNSSIPERFSLEQNYPNPFNPVTNLEFGISKLGFVSLKLYDALGKEVKLLVNEIKPAGNYVVEFDGSDLPSGIYFYKTTIRGTFLKQRE